MTVFTNETSKSKAVRIAGGHVVMKAGETREIAGEWGEDYLAHLAECGVTVKAAPKPQKSAPKAKEAS